MIFKDRVQAGQQLANLLQKYQGQDVVVYALPRGGVITALQVATSLHAPLDLIITRKIGHPTQPEYAIGAVDDQGNKILNKEDTFFVDQNWLDQEIQDQIQEANRRKKLYLQDRQPVSADNKIAIIVDDGIATGLTAQAAILALKNKYQPQKTILAAPIIPSDTLNKLKTDLDEVVAVLKPEDFFTSIGAYYEYFPQVTDQEVTNVLKNFR